jgi:hypothetical protein
MTEIVFAEIGDRAYPVDKKHFQAFFPGVQIRVITDGPCIGDRNHPRWGWRMNDFHKVLGLLESKADIAISFDADMRIVSQEVKTIVPLVRTFGLCLPANPRKLVGIDNDIGADGQQTIDDDMANMYAFNCGIIALDKKNERAVECAKTFINIMRFNPMRGPVAWAKAFWGTGFFPCLLPPQWCVCGEDIGIENEIVLHVGHEKIREHYAQII